MEKELKEGHRGTLLPYACFGLFKCPASPQKTLGSGFLADDAQEGKKSLIMRNIDQLVTLGKNENNKRNVLQMLTYIMYVTYITHKDRKAKF